ncbi:MAG: SRPBCC family protein [Desulfofustis sp.]|nr:SRPBCC family protein [Desulfofustis sp.]
MSEIKQEIVMNVPAEKVFQFVAETPNLVEVWPSLIYIGEWSRDENGFGEFKFTYQMAGFKYSGRNKDLEFVPGKRIVTESKGGMDALVTWEFEPFDGGTRVLFTGDYTVSIPMVGKLISDRIAALNAIEVGILLQNIKKKMEG